MLDGFQHGFRIGFTGVPNNTIYPNHKSANDHPGVIEDYLSREVKEGRMRGLFDSLPSYFHCSPLAVVPKKTPGTFRVIHNLSYPTGNSVNDFIPEYFSRVTYQSVYDAIVMLSDLGKGAFMSKTDVEKAFRIIPINPADQHLFYVHWEGKFYLDLRMEMGCSSSCQIFEAFSSAIAWVAQSKLNIPTVHYLDDFLFGSESRARGAKQLEAFIHMYSDIGIPLAMDKTFAPARIMSFLGYEIDTILQEIRLPEEKIIRCRDEIDYLIGRKKVRLKNFNLS